MQCVGEVDFVYVGGVVGFVGVGEVFYVDYLQVVEFQLQFFGVVVQYCVVVDCIFDFEGLCLCVVQWQCGQLQFGVVVVEVVLVDCDVVMDYWCIDFDCVFGDLFGGMVVDCDVVGEQFGYVG